MVPWDGAVFLFSSPDHAQQFVDMDPYNVGGLVTKYQVRRCSLCFNKTKLCSSSVCCSKQGVHRGCKCVSVVGKHGIPYITCIYGVQFFFIILELGNLQDGSLWQPVGKSKSENLENLERSHPETMFERLLPSFWTFFQILDSKNLGSLERKTYTWHDFPNNVHDFRNNVS